MAGASREQALSLLAAAKNHGDLAVKISSFKQVKEILLSMEPSSSSDLFPYIAELHTSPESLVRKYLVELMEELGMKSMERSFIFMPVLLALLKDDNPDVVRQSIISGTNFFCSVLREISLQFHHSGKVERWFEEFLLWMGKFKDVVCVLAVEPGSIGAKLLALKFLEIYVVLFTEATDSEAILREGKGRSFSVSHLFGVLPLFDPAKLTHEVNKVLGHFLGLLHPANTLQGSLVIAVINCLAGIARKRPLLYNTVLSALLDFNPNFEALKGGHTASIRYSVRTAFLGFLRCTNPAIMESRERLIRALRAMNAGDAADQVIRQVDKMQKNTERASREVRFIKEDPTSAQIPVSGDLTRKKPMTPDADGLATNEMAFKRSRFSMQDDVTVNGVSSKAPLPENNSPAERLITMIGALLAEGERGAQSLEILISNIHPDLMADIVITNMKHLPRSSPPLSSRLGNFPTTSQAGPSTTSSQVVTTVSSTLPVPLPSMASSSQVAVPPSSLASGISISASDMPPPSNISMDLKRDPRRDPRRFDPRRAPTPAGLQKTEDVNDLQCGVDGSSSLNGPSLVPVAAKVVHTPDLELSENLVVPLTETRNSMGKLEIADEGKEVEPTPEVRALSDLTLSPVRVVEQDRIASATSSEGTGSDSVDASSMLESGQCWSAASSLSASEEIGQNLPLVPPYVDLTDVQKGCLCNLAFTRIVEAYKEIQATGSSHTRQALLARLVAQNVPDDDIVVMLQKHVVSEYQHQKGHELAVHVLFDLHSLVISESDEHARLSAAKLYEKFLLAVVPNIFVQAMSLRDTLPASDKSFSRLLGEVPLLPDSALRMLEDLCHSVGFDKDARDGDRVTQGLGAVWSLILGRPPNRQACLDIALKCAVHSQDDVRAKAIRLVANKLYLLSYISENIELFATDTMLSVVDQQATVGESRKEANVGNQETSPSGSQNSEHESDTSKGLQLVSQTNSTVSLSQAQRHMSLFFALCTKKPSLLKIVFDIYGRAPKTVKQTAHRHIPILVRTLASSYHELLHIISDPPQGCENLLMLVLQILTEETTPSADLIATVKHLYETKLKDAAILIPMLSSLSKDEVLPIFPQLLGLPLEKFQAALARILQGSAHTGPALTPTEVLIAIHDISPEKEGVALKKITDACSACFEQRTVFTQQVLAKSLNQLVERTPLPLLFMRTVIQAVDAYPALVDFVMEILSKLVSKQIWRMPKLWVGFLKCASQTAPHSFRVLLQLPSQQLEMALNRHANLRVPLAAHTNQPSIRNSVPRATLAVLGLVNESHTPRSYKPTSLQDTSTSVHGATLT